MADRLLTIHSRCRISAARLLASVGVPMLLVAGSVRAAEDGPSIDHVWARATPGAATVGAAYLRIRSPIDDRLVSVTSPVAGRVELHDHLEHDGMMQMEVLEGGLPVKADQQVEFRSGSLHLMLIDLRTTLKAGDRFPLTLVFEKTGQRSVMAEVVPLGARGPSAAAEQIPTHASRD
ncbi:MAG TPA: copper chaperone PCu(A)C [Acetobacteraceae bacterium]|nr:copper chaperone PCu(A)C [Acetobacteraceae bacterium]